MFSWIRRSAMLCSDLATGPRRPIRKVEYRPKLEVLEDRLVPATTRIWDGGATFGDAWTNANNWVGNTAPVSGDNLLFPSGIGALDRTTNNDFSVGTVFGNITFEGTDYRLSGNRIRLAAGAEIASLASTGTNTIEFDILRSSGDTQLRAQNRLVFSGRFTALADTADLIVRAGTGGSVVFSGGGSNIMGGTTRVQEGLLQLSKTSGVNALSGPLNIGGGGAGTATAHVQLLSTNQLPEAIPVTVQASVGGNAASILDLGSSSEGIELILAGGQVRGGGTLSLSDDLNVFASGGVGNLLSINRLTLASTARQIINNDALVIQSIIQNGGLTKRGPGQLTLRNTASNTYTGLQVLGGVVQLDSPAGNSVPGELRIGLSDSNAVGIVKITRPNQIADSALVTVNSSGTLLVSAAETVNNLVVNGDLDVDLGADLTVNGFLHMNQAGGSVSALAGSDLIVNGPMEMNGGSVTTASNLFFNNGLDMTASSISTFNGGAVTVNGLARMNGSSTTMQGNLFLNNGLEMTASSISTSTGATTLAGELTTLAAATPSTIAGTLKLLGGGAGGFFPINFSVADGEAIQDLVISAGVQNGSHPPNNLNKVGAGTMVLAGNNTYTSDTTLAAGTLLVTGNLPALNKVTVNGGTLGGTGTVGKVTANGGTISPSNNVPGSSNGILFADDLFLNPNSTLLIELNGVAGFQQDAIAGAPGLDVRLGDQVNGVFPTLDLRVNFASAVGDFFTIVRNMADTGSNGIFKDTEGNPLPQGAIITVNGQAFQIVYNADFNSKIVLFHMDTPPAFQNRSLTASILEGQVATLTGTITEHDPLDTFFLDVNWGDGTPVQTYTFPPGSHGQTVSVTHRYLDNGNFNVFALWRDPHGGGNSATLPIEVKNVAPDLTNLRVDLDGHRVTLSGQIIDPGRDSYTLVVHWGDADKDTYHFARGTTRFVVNHRYDDPGRYKIRLNLSDDDGGKDQESMILDLASRGRRNDPWWIALGELLRDDA